jgi:type I restriction enzyme S subunit
MIEELRAYSDFKATGLPWLAQIPSHWNLIPNRALVRRRKQLVGRNYHRYRLLSLTKQGVIVRDVASGKGKFSSDMGTSQEVRKGDLVFCFFDVPETPRTVGLSPHYGMITGAYTVLEPLRPGVSPYFEQFYRAMDDSKLLSPLYSGLRNTIPVDRFLGTKTPLPPPEEQEAIVRFLDHAHRRIEYLVKSKRKEIALLTEKRDVIVERAVTQGLQSTRTEVRRGLEWLGSTPTDWHVTRIKYLLREVDERSRSGSEALLSVRMHHGVVPFAEHFSRPPQAASLIGFKVVRPGQLVINRMQAGNGVIFPSRYHGLVSPDYAVFNPIGDVNVDFLGELFRCRTVRTKFRSESKGLGTGTSGFLRLYNDRLGAIHVSLPNRSDQDRILEHLSLATRDVDRARSRLEREVALISEYRTRLIADVVTGQLDVRATAAGLPTLGMAATPTELEGDEGIDIEDGEAA